MSNQVHVSSWHPDARVRGPTATRLTVRVAESRLLKIMDSFQQTEFLVPHDVTFIMAIHTLWYSQSYCSLLYVKGPTSTERTVLYQLWMEKKAVRKAEHGDQSRTRLQRT